MANLAKGVSRYGFLVRTLLSPSRPHFPIFPPVHRPIYRQRKPTFHDLIAIHAAACFPMESDENIGAGEARPTVDEKESSPPSDPCLPQPPEKPEPGDCCGNGCFPCVWDLYYEELEAYNKHLENYQKNLSS
ncbi:hypothetical protein HPP92_028412 [Vanilla planifolia]|uniref:Oxidoreductase-like domain-containing protein n=1 Tax=Vanilla planifolia TaxID=51239 RepID=A0A835P8M4_VANPL|nr:hypothetical protein HPP92_028412 [Vanilla planifolia]KAG0447349.1 hypothetical protein HPP92_028382 [Vanilla planifolia]